MSSVFSVGARSPIADNLEIRRDLACSGGSTGGGEHGNAKTRGIRSARLLNRSYPFDAASTAAGWRRLLGHPRQNANSSGRQTNFRTGNEPAAQYRSSPDSPLEGGGFEPLVPRRRPSCESASNQDPGGFLRYPFNSSLRIHCTVGPRLAAIGTPPRTRICQPAEIPGLSAGVSVVCRGKGARGSSSHTWP